MRGQTSFIFDEKYVLPVVKNGKHEAHLIKIHGDRILISCSGGLSMYTSSKKIPVEPGQSKSGQLS